MCKPSRYWTYGTGWTGHREVSTRWGPWSGQTFELLGLVNSHTHFNNGKEVVSYDIFGFKGHTGTSCFCRSVSRPLYRRGRDTLDGVNMTKACVEGNDMDSDAGKTEMKRIHWKREHKKETNEEDIENEDIHDPDR